MSEILGKGAFINVDGVLVARMRSFSLTVNGEVVDATAFGASWIKNLQVINGWTATVEGMTDILSTEQTTLRDANEDGTKLTAIDFYLDSTSCYECDLVTDAEAGAYISSYVVNAENKNVVNFTMTVTGTGPLKFTS